MTKPSVGLVIPTFNRRQVLLDTINYLLGLELRANELLVVDQTQDHPAEVAQQLSAWHEKGDIKWLKLESPSVVAAMNVGLKESNSDYVLFVDDDIRPDGELIENYQTFLSRNNASLIAGRVIQPWDNPAGVMPSPSAAFSFNSLRTQKTNVFIGCNFLVKRELAISLGGFDENFRASAHDYEREFSDRVSLSGHEIDYLAEACVYHLKEEQGGIRSNGHYLKTVKPHHSVGAYYYILRSKAAGSPLGKLSKIARRMIQRISTKTHLRQPWWIPLTLIGDILGLFWAIALWLSGPKLFKDREI